MLRIWSLGPTPRCYPLHAASRVPLDGGSMWIVSIQALSNLPNRRRIATQIHTKRVMGVRREAFGWYADEPPSPMEAAVHFAERAESDSENRSLYAEALGLFLATCWNIHPYQQRIA